MSGSSRELTVATEKHVLPPQVHMNVITCPTPPHPTPPHPTPPHPPDVYKTARPSKGRGPTRPSPISDATLATNHWWLHSYTTHFRSLVNCRWLLVNSSFFTGRISIPPILLLSVFFFSGSTKLKTQNFGVSKPYHFPIKLP